MANFRIVEDTSFWIEENVPGPCPDPNCKHSQKWQRLPGAFKTRLEAEQAALSPSPEHEIDWSSVI